MHPADVPHPLAHRPDLPALQAALMRFARSRLRNPDLAADAVSETLLAALEAQPSFTTPAQAMAWVFGVLRHKLVDQLRQQARETPAGDELPDTAGDAQAWTGAGAWHGGHSPMDQPEEACSQREFLALVQRCCNRLPALQREVFLAREVRGLTPEAICEELGISAGNLWVLVHRARRQLQAQVAAQWPLPAGLAGAGKAAPPQRCRGSVKPNTAPPPGPSCSPSSLP